MSEQADKALRAATPTAWSLRAAAGRLQELQKWRRCEPPYNTGEGRTMPLTGKEFSAAIDTAIAVMLALAAWRGDGK